jgi:hypothetical protein
MAALADMDLGELKAQLAAVEAAVHAKQTASEGAAALAGTIKNKYSKLYDRVSVSAVHACPEKGASLIGASIVVGGWVKTGRVADKGALCFLEINDGTGPVNLQCVVRADVHAIDELKATGTCVVVEGEVKAPPEGASQAVELHVSKVLHVGPCDAAKYPIAKKKISLEFLREKIHLRTRTNTIAAIARIRSALSYATHTFFHENGFLYVHTPLITQSDCEGAGEMFQVTTLLGAADAAKDDAPAPTPEAVASKRADVSAAGEAVKAVKDAAKAEGGDKAAVKPAVDAMLKLKNELAEMETAGAQNRRHLPRRKRQDRLRARFLQRADVPHRLRAAQRGDVRVRDDLRVHVRAHVPGGELQHHAPPRRVLDDRARDRLRRLEGRHAVRRGLRAPLPEPRAEEQPRGPGVSEQDVRQGEPRSHRERRAERLRARLVHGGD